MKVDHNQAVRSIPLITVFGWLGVDCSQFKTRKSGTEWYGKCIFHEAKTNQGSFSFTSELWNCFSCQSSGRGAIDAVKAYQKCGFQTAVDWLKARMGTNVHPNEKNPVQVNSDAVEGVLEPYKGSYHKFKVESAWLNERVPDQTIRERYGVFAYDNKARKSAYSGRVMLPVRNMNGILYGYLGRDTSSNPDAHGQPKYLFPKNLPKSRFLFGAYELLQAHGQERQRIVYLVESPFSVLRFASLGLPAVSPFGWSVSEEQRNILWTLARGVVFLPDTDKRKDALAHVGTLAERLWVRSPPLPESVNDPEFLGLEEIQALTR